MKVYLAAPWTHRPEARAAAAHIEAAGHEITERWWNHEDAPLADAAEMRRQAQADINGVLAADVLLLLNLAKSEGKAVEQGIALQRGIPIVAIGENTNVFQHLPAYEWVASLEEALGVLNGR